MLPCRLQQCLDPLTPWFAKGVLNQDFEGIQVTTFFWSNNFGHIEAMKVIFLSKYSRFYVDYENAIKFEENVDGFEDNWVSTCCWSFCQLWEEDMWSTANVLKSGPKIWDPT